MGGAIKNHRNIPEILIIYEPQKNSQSFTDMGGAIKNHRNIPEISFWILACSCWRMNGINEYKLVLSESLYAFSYSNSRNVSSLDKGTPAFKKAVTTFIR